MKADVNAQLTKKTEHVLFCSLTSEQRSVYRAFLASTEVEQIDLIVVQVPSLSLCKHFYIFCLLTLI